MWGWVLYEVLRPGWGGESRDRLASGRHRQVGRQADGQTTGRESKQQQYWLAEWYLLLEKHTSRAQREPPPRNWARAAAER